MGARTVYFERTLVGGLARVCAVCSETGQEAVVFGPATLAPTDMEQLALRKLERLLELQAKPPTAESAQPTSHAGSARRGKLV